MKLLPEEKWQDTANMMVEQFELSGRPVFKGVSPLVRGTLRKKDNKETIHFSADASNTELFFFRTVHPANQLSVYGAVARWCEDVGMKSDEKPPKTRNDEILKEVQTKEVSSLVKS